MTGSSESSRPRVFQTTQQQPPWSRADRPCSPSTRTGRRADLGLESQRIGRRTHLGTSAQRFARSGRPARRWTAGSAAGGWRVSARGIHTMRQPRAGREERVVVAGHQGQARGGVLTEEDGTGKGWGWSAHFSTCSARAVGQTGVMPCPGRLRQKAPLCVVVAIVAPALQRPLRVPGLDRPVPQQALRNAATLPLDRRAARPGPRRDHGPRRRAWYGPGIQVTPP